MPRRLCCFAALASLSLGYSAGLGESDPAVRPGHADVVNADVGIEYFFGQYAEYTDNNDVRLQIEGELPQWLSGSYFVGGPHRLQVGETKVTHYLDGLGKIHRFSFNGSDGGRGGGGGGSGDGDGMIASWTSADFTGQIDRASAELGKYAPSVIFQETTPPRCTGKICYLKNLFGVNDNTYVQQIQMGDNYMYGLTDDAYVTAYDTSLNYCPVNWTDNLSGSATVAHAVKDLVSGTVTGLMSNTPKVPLVKASHTVYRMTEAEPDRRVEVAYVELKSSVPPYQHSFGLSSRHAVICEHAWTFDDALLMEGKMVMDASIINGSEPTNLILVDLESGKSTTFQSPEAFLCIHFANTWENETAIIFDMPTWQDATPGGNGESAAACNPYGVFSFDTVHNKSARDGFSERCRNRLVRHALHVSGEMKGQTTFTVIDEGWYEYPVFNQNYRGQASCYLYLTQFYHSAAFGDLGIVKHDSCTGAVAAVWHEPGHYPSEPHFVANPNGDGTEDDGVIVTPIMNGTDAGHLSYFLVLSAKDLTEVARMPLGASIPATVHGWFKFD